MTCCLLYPDLSNQMLLKNQVKGILHTQKFIFNSFFHQKTIHICLRKPKNSPIILKWNYPYRMKFINIKIDYFKLTESISINVLSLSSESNDYSLSPQTSD
jgi:hypothetical protein